MNLFLLAAGEGTRLRPYTLTHPKPAIPFLNVPLAYYSLSFAQELMPSRVIVNTFHLPQKIEEVFSKDNLSRVGWSQPVHFSSEGDKIRGNGGALAFCRTHSPGALNIHNDTLLMNGDEITIPKDPLVLQKAYMEHLKEQNLATLITMNHPDAGGKFGAVWTHPNSNRVIGFGKQSPQPGLRPNHYVGAMFLSPRIFDYLNYDDRESNILYDDVLHAMNEGEKVQTYPIDCFWHETGNPQDYLAATNYYLSLYESTLSLRNLIENYAPDPQQFIQHGSTRILKSQSVKLTASTAVEGFAVIHAPVQDGTYIKDSVIFSTSNEKRIENQIIL